MPEGGSSFGWAWRGSRGLEARGRWTLPVAASPSFRTSAEPRFARTPVVRVAGRLDLPPSPDLSSGLGVGAVPGGGWGVGRLPGWQIRRLRPQLAGLLRDANHSQTPAEMGGGGGGGAAGGGVPFFFWGCFVWWGLGARRCWALPVAASPSFRTNAELRFAWTPVVREAGRVGLLASQELSPGHGLPPLPHFETYIYTVDSMGDISRLWNHL